MLAPLASAVIRSLLRLGGRLSGRERASFARLRAKAIEVRTKYLLSKRFGIVTVLPVGQSNVAALEYCPLGFQETIQFQATPREKSPTPKPVPRSEGGYFEPSIDLRARKNGAPMDTDAEYKALSALAARLEETAGQKVGVVYLFTELQPCASCTSVIAQFEERFPLVSVVIEFDYPYPKDASEEAT